MSARTSAKEGRNIKIGVVDEVHEMKDDSFIMPIRQALSTQDEPLYIEITTDGFTEGGYLDERLKMAASVLNGELDKSNFLIFWYTQDTEEEIWQDENSWYKSNPGLGVIKKWSFLRGMVEDAKISASTRAFVLAKDFNLRQNNAAAWLTERVVANDATFEPEMLRGQYYIGGIDLSETTDLTAATALFVNPWTLQKYALSMYFIPETKADALLTNDKQLNPEKKNYREWARQGLVKICAGRMGVLESDFTLKRLNYRNNEITKWNLQNTALKLNNLGMKMPVKISQSKNRIDGTLALIIAYATVSRYMSEYNYLQRDVCQPIER